VNRGKSISWPGGARTARILHVEIRPATWNDLTAVVDLIAAQSRAARGVPGITVEHLRGDWGRPDFRLAEDAFVAETGGRLAGYAAVTPEGALTLAAADERLVDVLFGRISARARDRGDASIAVTVNSDAVPPAALVRRRPFELQRKTLLMWRELGTPVDEPRLPEGMTLRTFEPGDGRAVHDLLDEAYLAWDRSYVPMAHDAWTAWMTGDSEFDATVWWLAERNGTLVGCALHWSSGWLKDIAVRESERGHGLGAALVQQGLAEFTRRGVHRVGLKVDADNPTGAVRLYVRMGFVITNSEAVWVSSL
jgi:ribosomal protein S18 acetylase RimI-like enzyme